MSRLLSLVIGLLLGLAAGIAGYRLLGPSTIPVTANSSDTIQRMSQDIVRLESDRLTLQAEVRQLQTARQQQEQQNAELQRNLQAATESNLQLQVQASETAGQLTIAEAAKETLAAELASTQQEVNLLQQNLAFFEQLIPENSKSDAGVSIRSADVAWLSNGSLRFRVLVMRTQHATTDFQGRLEFTATGTKDGRSATISLERSPSALNSEGADASDKTESIALQFRQYQRVNGQLIVPAGCEPKSVTVKVLEGKTVRSEHTIGIDPKESTQ